MNKEKIIILLVSINFLLISCGSMDEAKKVLSNEKIRTTDEFLVKKRDPLTLPPDFRNIPAPDSLKNKNKNKKDNLEKILKIPEERVEQNNVSAVERAIINEIGN
tara:strand:- start:320 stop:634 length:315 start_codon:yes stop_codon:yes gene_type:complete